MINRFVIYLLMFSLIQVPLMMIHFVSKWMLRRDPESPILNSVKTWFKGWAYFEFPMRFFYFVSFDILLVAGLNIKIFASEKHIWSHYMEASFILSCLVASFILCFCCLIPICLKRAKGSKHGLNEGISPASKGLNQKWKFMYLCYFIIWFGGRLIFTVLILIGD